jgi:hypothetical protein
LAELAKRDEAGRWTRGIVLVGPLADAIGVIDSPVAKVAGDLPVVRHACRRSDRRLAGPGGLRHDVVRAGRLFASPLRAATRGIASATVGEAAPADLPTDRVTFEQLAVAPAQAEVFGRADLTPSSTFAGCRPERVRRGFCSTSWWRPTAPARRRSSAFSSTSACSAARSRRPASDASRSALPDGLVGTIANVRAIVQRDSAQGDCRFEPQGYPAQILGSSALVLASADGAAHDFSDLTPRFAHGLELLLPASAADQPNLVLGLVAEVVNQLSPDVAPLSQFHPPAVRRRRTARFIAVSDRRPRAPIRACASIAAAWR